MKYHINKEGQYNCPKCSTVLQSLDALCKHNKVHSHPLRKTLPGDTEVVCKECGKMVTKCHIVSHMNLHAGTQPFNCSFCPKTYPSKEGMTLHYLTVHRLKEKEADDIPEMIEDSTQQERRTLNEGDYVCSESSNSGLEMIVSVPIQVTVPSDITEQRLDCDDASTIGSEAPEAVSSDADESCSSSDDETIRSIEVQLKTSQKQQNSSTPTKANKNPIKCSHCDRVYSCKRSYERHCSTVHRQMFQCTRCCRYYNSKDVLVRHFRAHHFTLVHKFQCSECDMNFNWKSGLMEHCNRNHGGRGSGAADQLFQCSECGTICRSKQFLLKHCRSYHGGHGYDASVRVFHCSECGNRYHWRSGYLSHRKKHHAGRGHAIVKNSSPPLEKALQCSKGGSLSDSRQSLIKNCHNEHNDTGYSSKCRKNSTPANTNRKKTDFQCTCCGLTLDTRESYKIHLFSHSSNHSFSCDVCAREYSSVTQLWVHQRRMHQKYKCIQKPLLHRHKNSASSNRKPFVKNHQLHKIQNKKNKTIKYLKCKDCAKQFSSASSLHRHSCASKQAGNFSATKAATSPQATAPAMLLDPVIVPLKCASGRGYKCALCGRVLTRMDSFKEHMNVHTGVRPHTCDKCGKSFSRYSQRSKHMKLEHSDVSGHSLTVVNRKRHKSHQTAKKQVTPSSHILGNEKQEDTNRDAEDEQSTRDTSMTLISRNEDERLEQTPVAQDSSGDCFRCGVCGVSLQQYTAYMEHMNQHTQLSNSTFSKNQPGQNKLKHQVTGGHLSNQHKTPDAKVTEKEHFACQQCDRAYVKASSLKRHIRFEHPKPRLSINMQLRSTVQPTWQESGEASDSITHQSTQGSPPEPEKVGSTSVIEGVCTYTY